MTKVSIVVPIYNAEKYIGKCLSSLTEQTFKDVEFICVNDGSKDESLSILNKYAKKDERVKVFSQKNSGPATARNLALKNASGKYVMFCDSDDWYEPEMCQKMLNAIESGNYDLAMCDCNIEEEASSHNRPTGDRSYHHLKLIGAQVLNDKNKPDINVVLWNKIFRKDLIDRYKISFPDGYECDDVSFIYQYLGIAKKAYGINEPLYNYLLRENSIMGNFQAKKSTLKRFDIVYAMKMVRDFYSNNNLLSQGSFILKAMSSSFIWSCGGLNKKDKITALELMGENVVRDLDYNLISDIPILKAIKLEKYKKAIELFKNKNSKSIRLFGIPLYRIKTKGNKVKYSLLGVPVFIIKEKYKKKSYYIFGIKFWVKKNKKSKDVTQNGFTEITLNNIYKRIADTSLVPSLHKDSFMKYKNCFAGKDIVLVATGPTLLDYKPIKDAIHVGVNKSFLWDKKVLDILFIQDSQIGIDILNKAIDYKNKNNTEMFLGIVDGVIISESVALRAKAKRYYTDYLYRPNFEFAFDISSQRLGDFCSVCFSAMQFILWTNPKRIYMVGNDCSSAGYFNEGSTKNYLEPSVARNWEKLRDFANLYYPETEIISINPVGLRGVFRDIYNV